MTIIIDGTVGANKAVVLDSNGKLPVIDGSLVTTLNATQVTTGSIATARIDTGTTTGKVLVLDGSGNMPAIAAGGMTGVESSTKSASDPTVSTNSALGTKWINTTSGEIFILTDATAGSNVWTSTGGTSGDVGGPSWYGGRGIVAGGKNQPAGLSSNIIEYITIATTGNAVDFGDLTIASHGLAGCSSGSRGVIHAGFYQIPSTGYTNIIDYVTISTSGNATDFGDSSVTRTGAGSGSNGTRGLWCGGKDGSSTMNVIDYVTLSTTGNAADFGDLTTTRKRLGSISHETRCVSGNGELAGKVLDYVTIATTGNAIDFGDMIEVRPQEGTTFSLTRGLWASGNFNSIEYITIATPGNATDFGDLSAVRGLGCNGASNLTRGVFCGGQLSGNSVNIMEYVTIATTGNTTDFGDLTLARDNTLAALSGD